MRIAIFGAISIWLSLVCTASAQPTGEQSVTSCAWSQLPANARQDFLSAYMGSGKTTTTLEQQLALYNAAMTACTGRNDIPPILAQIAVVSQSIKHGSATKLATTTDITAAKLEAAWAKAPADAVQCNLAKAAEQFGLKSNPCPDRKALFWFLSVLNIPSPATNFPTVSEVQMYFAAKGQEQLAEEHIAKFIAGPR